MNVGVRDLKQHLSEHLRRVADGQTITVTDRGVPVAVITPVVPGDPLATAIDEGWVRPAVSSAAVGHGPRARASRRVLDTLREDRGE
jgi:prevent-host-death family protein